MKKIFLGLIAGTLLFSSSLLGKEPPSKPHVMAVRVTATGASHEKSTSASNPPSDRTTHILLGKTFGSVFILQRSISASLDLDKKIRETGAKLKSVDKSLSSRRPLLGLTPSQIREKEILQAEKAALHKKMKRWSVLGYAAGAYAALNIVGAAYDDYRHQWQGPSTAFPEIYVAQDLVKKMVGSTPATSSSDQKQIQKAMKDVVTDGATR